MASIRKTPAPRRAARPVRASRAAVARLRRICLALPEAVEKPSHGEPTWFAGRGKVFATLDDHHHRAAHLSAWLPLPLGAQEALVGAAPDRFFRPPYVGGKGWVAVVLDGEPDWAQVARLVRDAYAHVATARQRAVLGRVPGPGPAKALAPGPGRTPSRRPGRVPAEGRALADLAGLGPAMLEDLRRLGVPDVPALARQDPDALYRRLCALTAVRQDPCVLDTFRCAVAQARDPALPPEQRRWWWWSRQRRAAAVGA